MMTTGRGAMATVAKAIGIKWNFPEIGRTASGVRRGIAGPTVGGTGLSMTEAGLLPATGAGKEAGTQTAATFDLYQPVKESVSEFCVLLMCVHRERHRHRESRRSQSPDRHRKRPRRYKHLLLFNISNV